jgi:hypothetical protein
MQYGHPYAQGAEITQNSQKENQIFLCIPFHLSFLRLLRNFCAFCVRELS